MLDDSRRASAPVLARRPFRGLSREFCLVPVVNSAATDH
jgi:hypothetical protein